MLRMLFGQILSGLVLVGILVGWWMAAGRDFTVMMEQAYSVAMWVGQLFEPLMQSLFGATASATAQAVN